MSETKPFTINDPEYFPPEYCQFSTRIWSNGTVKSAEQFCNHRFKVSEGTKKHWETRSREWTPKGLENLRESGRKRTEKTRIQNRKIFDQFQIDQLLPEGFSTSRESILGVEWRLQVLLRDDYTCSECQVRDTTPRNMSAHHIIEREEGHYKPSDFLLSNGITLCRACHCLHHQPKRYASRWGGKKDV